MPDTRETNGNLLGIHGYPALLYNKHFGLSGRHPDPKTGFFIFCEMHKRSDFLLRITDLPDRTSGNNLEALHEQLILLRRYL